MTTLRLNLEPGHEVRERVETVATQFGEHALFEIRMLAAEAVERINRKVGQQARRLRERQEALP